MAVSNPATLESVYTEFGAPQGTGLSAFLKGGSYVPNTSANANVPTALPIKLSQLAGAVKYVNVSASLSPTTVTGTGTITGEPISTNATTVTASGGTGSYTYTWSYVSGSTKIQCTGGQTASFYVPTGTAASAYSAVWKCKVSDGTSSAAPTVTANITVNVG